jgi:hypothetical protein
MGRLGFTLPLIVTHAQTLYGLARNALMQRDSKMTDFYENHQWKVTEEGLESIGQQSENFIEAKRLGQLTDRKDSRYYEWPLHFAEKTWVDIEAFLVVFCKALEIHRAEIDPPINLELLSESSAEARRIANQGLVPEDEN